MGVFVVDLVIKVVGEHFLKYENQVLLIKMVTQITEDSFPPKILVKCPHCGGKVELEKKDFFSTISVKGSPYAKYAHHDADACPECEKKLTADIQIHTK